MASRQQITFWRRSLGSNSFSSGWDMGFISNWATTTR